MVNTLRHIQSALIKAVNRGRNVIQIPTWWSETERRKRGRHRSKSAGNAINVAGAEDEALGVDRKWHPRRGESATEIAQVSPETPSAAKIERYPMEMALNMLEVTSPKIKRQASKPERERWRPRM